MKDEAEQLKRKAEVDAEIERQKEAALAEATEEEKHVHGIACTSDEHAHEEFIIGEEATSQDEYDQAVLDAKAEMEAA